MKKNKIVGIFRPVPKTKNSHNKAWVQSWADILNAELVFLSEDYQDAKVLYLYIDVNFKGENKVNLFDGLSEDIYNRLNKLLEFYDTGKKMIMLDYKIPDLYEIVKGRQSNKSTFPGFTDEFIENLKVMQESIDFISMSSLGLPNVTLGDSHSISVSDKGDAIIRIDAKTLGGALHAEDGKFINNRIPKDTKRLRLMFGSIDVRHHAFRQDNPYEYIDELLEKYKEKVKELQNDYEIEVHGIVPVEFEDRKMSDSMKYKKEPFKGSLEDRQKMTEYFNKKLSKFPCKVLHYPNEWYKMDPKVFAETVMERPRGIHIGESHYRRNNYGVQKEMDEW